MKTPSGQPPDGKGLKKPRRAHSTAAAKQRERQDQFLDTFAKVGNLSASARTAGIDRQTHYNWLEADPSGYGQRFADAEERAHDALEQEARRRAVVGVDEPVFYKGEIVGYIRKMSDVLLIFLLKAARPEKFRERWQGELTGKDGGPIQTQDISKLTTPELAQLRDLLLKARDR